MDDVTDANASILVVEDSPTQSERLRALLEDERYHVTVAVNGREALGRVRAAPPDLVISDVLMPELDGFAFCHAMKSDEATRAIPIVLLTTENSPLDVIIGLERGADNFVTKPFEPAYLLGTIRRILDGVRLRQQGKMQSDALLHVGNRDVAVPADRQQIIELLAALTQGADVGRAVESQRDQAEYSAQLGQLDRIRAALNNDRFVHYYQPILDIARGQVTQYEVLLRMIGENDRIIPPSDFLPAAEESGLINRIDLEVLHGAIGVLKDHHEQGHDLRLSVNISGKSLLRPSVVERMADALTVMASDPSFLTLEITETSVIDNMQQAVRAIQTLRDRGCRFALDDFGVGYSSIDYLKNLAVDCVKIDGSFIHDLPNKPTDQRLVMAITQMAHDLGKQVVAEFVGDRATLDILRELGVEFGQGYFIGRPMPGPIPLQA